MELVDILASCDKLKKSVKSEGVTRDDIQETLGLIQELARALGHEVQTRKEAIEGLDSAVRQVQSDQWNDPFDQEGVK